MPGAAVREPAGGGKTKTCQAARDKIGCVGLRPELGWHLRSALRIELEDDLPDMLRALHQAKGRHRVPREEFRAGNWLEMLSLKSLGKKSPHRSSGGAMGSEHRSKVKSKESQRALEGSEGQPVVCEHIALPDLDKPSMRCTDREALLLEGPCQ
jgi:hypothetical protein